MKYSDLRSLDLNGLVVLDALLSEQSVTRAAARVGLSTPAMSHALGRLRDQLGDPILTRAGRGMVQTERARKLEPRVRQILDDVRELFAAPERFDPSTLQREVTVHATDYVLEVMGVPLDRELARLAPLVDLQFRPNVPNDAEALRAGEADLAIGVYAALPPELKCVELFRERLVCVVRRDHPTIKRRLDLKRYVELPHIQVAPRGAKGGLVDDRLAQRGVARRIARIVPHFSVALELAARSDYLLTIPERLALSRADSLGLRVMAPPLELEPYPLKLLWHPRAHDDPAHRFVRELIRRVAKGARWKR